MIHLFDPSDGVGVVLLSKTGGYEVMPTPPLTGMTCRPLAWTSWELLTRFLPTEVSAASVTRFEREQQANREALSERTASCCASAASPPARAHEHAHLPGQLPRHCPDAHAGVRGLAGCSAAWAGMGRQLAAWSPRGHLRVLEPPTSLPLAATPTTMPPHPAPATMNAIIAASMSIKSSDKLRFQILEV